MKRWRSILRLGTVLGLAAAALWTGPAGAQSDPNTTPVARTERALIEQAFTQMGFAGQSPQIGRGRAGLGYPGVSGGTGAYGGVLSSYQSGEKATYGYGYSTSAGECTWILTTDGKVSMTGPRSSPQIAQYIRPVPYDQVGKPEEKWGVANPLRGIYRSSAVPPSLASYWPGNTKLDEGSIFSGTSAQNTPVFHTANYNLSGYIVDTKVPEDAIITQWSDMKTGILATRRAFDWSNPDFDDFVITEYTWTNIGDFDGDGKEDKPGSTAPKTAYFAFVNYEAPTAMGANWYRSPDGWAIYITQDHNLDDIYMYSDAGGYKGAFPAGMKASIWRDSDNPLTSWDDTGDPFYLAQSPPSGSSGRIGQTEEQMQAPSTWAMAPLAFRNSGASHVFNAADKAGKFIDPQGDQPIAAKWWHSRSISDFDDPYTETRTEKQMYDEMAAPGLKDNPNEANPDNHKVYVHAQVYGPYTLQAGEKARIVMAYAVGHPSQLKNMDILTWDRSKDPLSQKQTEMKTLGEQALLENVRLAKFAYDAEYQIPAAPTNAYIDQLDLTASPLAHQQITWVDNSDRALNPYYKEADVAGYRVYRSTWFPVGPWELRDVITKGASGATNKGSWTFSGGKYTYEDLESAAGFEYHFSVRPYAKGHAAWSTTLSDGSTKALADIPVARARTNVTAGYESGWGSGTARTYDGDGARPFQPVTAVTDNLDRKVLVVPNPYFDDGAHAYPATRNIRFVNIPRKCRIRIYSASGDFVRELLQNESETISGNTGLPVPKTANQKGEITWSQNTWNLSGFISAGLYYYVVISDTPGSQGKMQKGTFVVIK